MRHAAWSEHARAPRCVVSPQRWHHVRVTVSSAAFVSAYLPIKLLVAFSIALSEEVGGIGDI